MYYLLLIICYSIAILPFPLLYGISDVFYFIVYKLFRYRVKVVRNNLVKSFPEKSIDQIIHIEKKFYKSFFDQWLETIKLLTLTPASLNKRIQGNWSLLDHEKFASKRIHILLGHQFNWEWGNAACQINTKQHFAGLYLPISNKTVDKLMLKIRSRMGSILIPADNMLPHLKALKENPFILCFMADQTPANLKIAEWFEFMNQPAPFLTTPEKASRSAKATVIYAGVKKIKRGYYKVALTTICEDASLAENGSITKAYVQHLSDELAQQPENWLWSHRRWKRTATPETIVKKLQ